MVYTMVYITYFIYSSIHWVVFIHLTCFHLLLWIWVYKYLFESLLSILLGIYPEVNHVVILYTFFQGTTMLFFTVAVPFYIPTSNAQGFQFLYILTNICYSLFLWKSRPNGSEVASHWIRQLLWGRNLNLRKVNCLIQDHTASDGITIQNPDLSILYSTIYQL